MGDPQIGSLKSLTPLLLPMFDACRSAPGTDALIIRRALSERSELDRLPMVSVRPIQCGRTGRHWFWVLLPKQKWLGCRDETRQHGLSIIPWLISSTPVRHLTSPPSPCPLPPMGEGKFEFFPRVSHRLLVGSFASLLRMP
jgi:hypothetical protein